MIPSAILAGLLVGLLPKPWWIFGTALVGCGWIVVLISTDIIAVNDELSIVGSILLAVMNTLVGVSLTKVTTTLVGHVHRKT